METTQTSNTTNTSLQPLTRPIVQGGVLETTRDCGTCKECCGGWLWGEAHGIPFFPNHPCHYLDPTPGRCGGCTIYEDRPPICRDFQCLWLQDLQMPGWMKPEFSKVIMYQRTYEDIEGDVHEPGWSITWISMVECGETVDPTVLNWVITQARTQEFNLHYQVKKTDYYMGSPEFQDFARTYGLQSKTTVVVHEDAHA